jgi:AcrR family transcriptional regulator
MIVSMVFPQSTLTPARDRRVRRSRSALIRAAVRLVTDRGTAAVSITDIADAADVSRQVLYQQFGDRDTLLLEAALELARSELLPKFDDVPAAGVDREWVLIAVRHFAEHRVFYRAVLTESASFALTKGLSALLLPRNREALQRLVGDRLDASAIADLATIVTGGAATMINTWVVEGEDPLDPEEFTNRLMRAISVAAGT